MPPTMLAQTIAEAARHYAESCNDTLPEAALSGDRGPAESGPRRIAMRTERVSAASVRALHASLGHFELGALLGHGGAGAVYAGWDRSLARQVALKLLPDELAEDAEMRARFLYEARAQARLSSPHVAQIYYVGQSPAFFAMELVEGGTLDHLLGRGETLEPERARELMIEVASGLRAAHKAGLVHRDIKPSNLLLDSDGHVKIADFGVSKPIGADAQAMVGTPRYMAPEQARGEPVDQRTDMYSLGCTFYHLSSGEPPFSSPNALDVVRQHLCDTPRPLREIAPAVPAPLARIVMRLLEKDPRRRYASYDELIAALRAAAPSSVRRADGWTLAAAIGIQIAIAAALVLGLFCT